MSCAKTAEPIEMPFGIVWDVDSGGLKKARGVYTHWRHLANTIEPSVCGGDATCCQITLTASLVVVVVENVIDGLR